MHTFIIIASTFLIILAYFFHPIPLQGGNVDLNHHLLLGKTILQNQSIPATNIFTYTADNFSFIHSGWLSDVIFYLIFTFFQYNGLILFGVLLVLCTMLLFFFNTELKTKYIALCSVILLNMQIIIGRTEIRPELLSYLFLSLYLFILYKYRKEKTKLLYLLPILQILWVNVHIYFIVGVLTLLCFFIDALRSSKYRFSNKKIRTLGLVTLLTLTGNILNPYFIQGALYPFFFTLNYGIDVTENYPLYRAFTSYIDPAMLYFLFSFLSIWLLLLLFRKRIPFIDYLLVILFSLLSFYAVRNIPLFAIGTIIPATRVLLVLYEKVHLPLIHTFGNYTKLILVCACLFLISPGLFLSVRSAGIGFGVSDDAQEAVAILKTSNLSGRIFNNYDIGNYLSYYVYPEAKIFVNGSPEAFPEGFFQNVYYPSISSFAIFQSMDKKYNFNSIFYEYTNAVASQNLLLEQLIQSDQWKLVYVNHRIVVFLKNNEINKKYIAAHAINEAKISLQTFNMEQKENIRDVANLFRIFQWYEKMYELDLLYLQQDPYNCAALYEVAVYLNSKNDPLSNIYYDRLRYNCQSQ